MGRIKQEPEHNPGTEVQFCFCLSLEAAKLTWHLLFFLL